MSKNLAVCGDFGGKKPLLPHFKSLLLAALGPFGIDQITINESAKGDSIFIFIGEVADDNVDAVHQAIEQVITLLGGKYHYPDNK